MIINDDIDSDIVKFPFFFVFVFFFFLLFFLFVFLYGDVPRTPSYGVYILNLFALQECLVIRLTSMLKTLTAKLNFSNRDIGIINFGKSFLSFIVDTANWSLNTISD